MTHRNISPPPPVLSHCGKKCLGPREKERKCLVWVARSSPEVCPDIDELVTELQVSNSPPPSLSFLSLLTDV